MKKLLSLVLCLLLLLCFSACSKTEEGDASSAPSEDLSASVEAAVSEGRLPEAKFSLGTEISELKEYYNELEKQMEENHREDGHMYSDEDMLLAISEGTLSVTYEIGNEKYYYEKAKKSKGVAVVCSLADAFGIKHGTSKAEVEAKLSGLELKSVTAGEDELYFLPLSEALILRYKKGNHTLDFYFSNNELVATVLRNTDNWTI